jgi:hypothetical protein
VEWIGLIVVVIIALRVIARGGGFFDFLDSDARYQNWWTNFEFNALFGVLCLVIFGGVVWVLVQALKPETNRSPSYQPPAVITRNAKVHHPPH